MSPQRWAAENVRYAQAYFPELIHANDFSWFLVPEFPLTSRWNSCSTPLLIVQKGKYADFYSIPPNHFYCSPALRFENGSKPGHIFFDNDFNDRRKDGWARISYHINDSSYKPSIDVVSGTNLLTILNSLAKFFRTVTSKTVLGQFLGV